jgi:hypothetical protein
MGGDQKLRVCMGKEGIFGGAYIICSPRVPGHAHFTFSEDWRSGFHTNENTYPQQKFLW